MATVTVTFIDEKGGDLTMRIESDPPFPGPAASKKAKKAITRAQSVAAEFFEAMRKNLGNAQEDE